MGVRVLRIPWLVRTYCHRPHGPALGRWSGYVIVWVTLGGYGGMLALVAVLVGIVLTVLDYREVPLVIMAGGLPVLVLLGFVFQTDVVVTAVALYGVVAVMLCARYFFRSRRDENSFLVNEKYECSECQADVREEDKICPKCGAQLDEIEED